MSVVIQEVPGCCVASVIHTFGGSSNRGGQLHNKAQTLLNIAEAVVNYRQMGYSLDRLGVLIANVTTEQTQANEILGELGFVRSANLPKPKHPESDLVVWHIGGKVIFDWATAYYRDNRPQPAPRVTPAVATRPAAPVTWDEDFEQEDMN